MKLPKTFTLLFALLVVTTITILYSALSIQAHNDDDDVLDVSDDSFDVTDRDRRSRFSAASSHPESQMEFEDFGEEARYRHKKEENSKQKQQQKQEQQTNNNNNNNKKQKKQEPETSSSSSDDSTTSTDKTKKSSSSSEKTKTKKDEYQKKKDEYYKDKKPSSPSSSSSSSSSSTGTTLTEKVAYLLKTLQEVKSDFAARQNHLIRISNPNPRRPPISAGSADEGSTVTAPLLSSLTHHFNSSINTERGLKLLSQFIAIFGIQTIVDGDVLTRANSALATSRFDAKSLRSKIDAADKHKQQKSSSSNNQIGSGEHAPTGDSLPTQDHKLIALRKNIKIAEELIDELVQEEMRQRVTHKRLLRAGRLSAPVANKFISDVVGAAEERLADMRGSRSGEIDNAAPSSGDAREERRKRKEFQTTVKTLKQAQTSFQLFEKLLATRARNGNGITKSMEPLFVFSQMIARDSLNNDCMILLQAADEQQNQHQHQQQHQRKSKNSHHLHKDDESESEAAKVEVEVVDEGENGPFTTLGNFILEQYRNHAEKHFDKTVKQADKDLASKIYELAPTPTSGVAFGLDTSELVGLVLCLVVPIQTFHITFFIVCKIFAYFVFRKSNANNNNNNNINRMRLQRHQQKIAKASGLKGESTSGKKPKKVESSFVVVVLLTLIQLGFVFLLVDIPYISQRIEDLPLHPKNYDVTLPSILFAVLRLQVSDGTQARLACVCFLIALFQGLSVARSIVVHSEPFYLIGRGGTASNKKEENDNNNNLHDEEEE